MHCMRHTIFRKWKTEKKTSNTHTHKYAGMAGRPINLNVKWIVYVNALNIVSMSMCRENISVHCVKWCSNTFFFYFFLCFFVSKTTLSICHFTGSNSLALFSVRFWECALSKQAINLMTFIRIVLCYTIVQWCVCERERGSVCEIVFGLPGFRLAPSYSLSQCLQPIWFCSVLAFAQSDKMALVKSHLSKRNRCETTVNAYSI